jgi:hypothetical protein
MKEDSDLKSKLHLSSRETRLLERKLMKPIVKPHHLDAIEREKGAQPQWVPNVSLYDVGKENATNIL